MPRRRLVLAILILLILPQVIFWGGALSNQLVIAANRGSFPVLRSDCTLGQSHGQLDGVHACMTSDSHLKFLADWINLRDSIWSPGDVMLALGDMLMGPAFWMFVAFVLYQAQRPHERPQL